MGGIDIEINERKKKGERSGLSIRWQEGSALLLVSSLGIMGKVVARDDGNLYP